MESNDHVALQNHKDGQDLINKTAKVNSLIEGRDA